MRAYVLALETRDAACCVVQQLEDRAVLTASLNQLLRAASSIGANIAEGYARSTGTERARFFEYSLGSVRETKHCYGTIASFLDRTFLDAESARHSEMTRLLIVMVRRQRAFGAKRLQESDSDYAVS